MNNDHQYKIDVCARNRAKLDQHDAGLIEALDIKLFDGQPLNAYQATRLDQIYTQLTATDHDH